MGTGTLDSLEDWTGKEPPWGGAWLGEWEAGMACEFLLDLQGRTASMTGVVLLAHSAKWDLENLGGVRIKTHRCAVCEELREASSMQRVLTKSTKSAEPVP